MAGHQELLARPRWPADESGYFVAEDSGLPPYRVLLQMLRDRGIDPPMTWSKRDCVKVLGGILPYKERSANPSSTSAWPKSPRTFAAKPN
jgi:hypothetical protein